MPQDSFMDRFEAAGVIRRGHFMRTSGRHTDVYVQCARLFEHSQQAEEVCRALAERFRQSGAQLVMGAAIGGLLPGYEVARALGLPFIYCERKDGAMTLRRGFAIPPGAKVLIIEDEVTTGASVREMMEIVRALGGETVGVGCLVDKSFGKVPIDVPYEHLVSIQVLSHREGQCPLCAQGLALDRV
jgi:orotate phosphoribosyltransferase